MRKEDALIKETEQGSMEYLGKGGSRRCLGRGVEGGRLGKEASIEVHWDGAGTGRVFARETEQGSVLRSEGSRDCLWGEGSQRRELGRERGGGRGQSSRGASGTRREHEIVLGTFVDSVLGKGMHVEKLDGPGGRGVFWRGRGGGRIRERGVLYVGFGLSMRVTERGVV